MEKQREFITKFTEWSRKQNHILGLALVGSYACGLERPDSDVDFVIISDDADGLLRNDDWIQLFGRVSKTQLEDYGLVQSRRVFYEDGVEAEFGFTSREWLRTDPIDADTRCVLQSGYEILDDKAALFSTFNRAVDEFPSIGREGMTGDDVIDIYSILEGLRIEISIDGGWGVDALLNRQTRIHKDLDIAIQEKDVPKLLQLLEEHGYRQIKEDSEWNFVLGDDSGHQIDVHSFVFDNAGNLVDGIKYPATSLTGMGTINGHAVRCISPEYVVKFHSGYELTENDCKDVSAVCKKFDLELPEEYRHRKKRE